MYHHVDHSPKFRIISRLLGATVLLLMVLIFISMYSPAPLRQQQGQVVMASRFKRSALVKVMAADGKEKIYVVHDDAGRPLRNGETVVFYTGGRHLRGTGSTSP